MRRKASGFPVHIQSEELLGFVMDLQNRIFQVPERRVQDLKQLINMIIGKLFTVSAICLSRLAGSLVSMCLALGPVVRLWAQSIYSDMPCRLLAISLSVCRRRVNQRYCSGWTILTVVGTLSPLPVLR